MEVYWQWLLAMALTIFCILGFVLYEISEMRWWRRFVTTPTQATGKFYLEVTRTWDAPPVRCWAGDSHKEADELIREIPQNIEVVCMDLFLASGKHVYRSAIKKEERVT